MYEPSALALLNAPPLPSGWAYEPLENLLAPSGISYGIVQPGRDDPDGVPVVRVGDLVGGLRLSEPQLRVSPSVEAAYERTRLRGGEVLLSLVGTIGVSAVAPERFSGWNVNRAIAVIRPRQRGDAGWIKYCLDSPTAQRLMHTWKTTTVQGTLNLRDVRHLPIPCPPSAEQRAIADVLGALDGKIEANRRLVDICDTTWGTVAAAEIDGTQKPLSSLGRFVNGRAFTKGASGFGRMVVRIAELNSGPGGSTVYSDISVAEEHLARPGDLLFAWSGSLTVRRWFRSEAIVNQHIFKVLPHPGIPPWFLHARILQLLGLFRGIATDKATTMGHIQRHHLDEPVAVPSPERLQVLDQWCGPLWQRALKAEQESLVLAALRDTLLPRLLSGEMRVRVAESVVSEAV